MPYADEEPAESDVESVRERLKRKSDNKNKRKQLLAAASNEEVKEKGDEWKQTQQSKQLRQFRLNAHAHTVLS